MSLENRVVIVTGAGRGLGRAHALELGRQGARVIVNDLGTSGVGEGASSAPAEEVAAEIRAAGGQAMADGSDIADWDQSGALVKTAIEEFGGLDAVVNNAGILRDRMFVSSDVDAWDAVMRVHLRGHYCVARHAGAFWRGEVKAGRPVDARIVNTSSGAGLQGSIGQSAYATAKGGIAALTLVQAAEMGRYGVTSNAIAPAARTRMTEEVFAEMMRAPESGFDEMHPGNVAPLVAWLCGTESRGVSGRMFEVAGGKIVLSDGWRPGATVDKGARWEVSELGSAITSLLAEAPDPMPVYGA
jgi:NAD(P)-dependent dehydrogenase (short-subunit alcohol dehydrogenase family)